MNPILLHKEQGYTFIEIIIALLSLMVVVAAIGHYHSTSGVSGNQGYDLKAVDVLQSEANKLQALYIEDKTLAEFNPTGTGPPDDIFLFRYRSGSGEFPSQIHNVYYNPHDGAPINFNAIKSLGTENAIDQYHTYYETAYDAENFGPSDTVDLRTFTYCVDDGNTTTNNESSNEVDVCAVVIDDMGTPEGKPDAPKDDLLGYIGWWVEDETSGGETIKIVTIALQYWYPGADWKAVDPEVIVLKTTMY